MNKKNLLILSYDYPPSTGGVARLCHEITIGLQPFYNTIKVFTVAIPITSKPYKKSNVEIIRFPAKRVLCEVATIRAIRKIKDKDSYDVLCGIWHPEGILARLGGMKNIHILGHGAEFLPGASKFRANFWLPLYCKTILGKSKKVITNSTFTKNLVKNIQPKTNVTALPLAVDHTFFAPKKNTPHKKEKILKFVTVSRILQFKGHDFLLQVFESLPQEIQSKIEWHIAGTGPYLEQLKKLIKASPIASQIYLHGFIPDKDLPSFYNTKDIFILTTRYEKNSNQVEGFGLVFLEAQSCGIPAIGTNSGGIPDAVATKNGGWLVEQDHADSLHDLLTLIVKNPSLVKQQALKARNRVLEKFTWDIYCSKLHKILAS